MGIQLLCGFLRAGGFGWFSFCLVAACVSSWERWWCNDLDTFDSGVAVVGVGLLADRGDEVGS